MLSVLDDLIRRHRSSGVLVDTNMLLVYLVGLLNRDWVSAVQPDKGYRVEDFDFLHLVLGQFTALVVTASTLCEATNLADSRLNAFQREAFMEALALLCAGTGLNEHSAAMPQVGGSLCFKRLGYSDATIEAVARTGVPVFTDDGDLYRHLSGEGLEVFNYSHVRYFAL